MSEREYYSAIKMNEILPFVVTWMDLEGLVFSEINQIEKDKYPTISLICGIKKKKKPQTKQTKENKMKKKTHVFRKQIGGCQRQGLGVVGGGEMGKRGQKVQISSYKINKSWNVMYSRATLVRILYFKFGSYYERRS